VAGRVEAYALYIWDMKRWMVVLVLSGSKWEGCSALSMVWWSVGMYASREGSFKLLFAEGNDDDRP
jgi:hypothetical protein